MPTQTIYIGYRLSTPTSYTYTHLAAHLSDVSHDQVNRFLRVSTLPANQLRELMHPCYATPPRSFCSLMTVYKTSATTASLVAKRPYSGNAHGMVTGIGLGRRNARAARPPPSATI